MQYPILNEIPATRDIVDVFGGYNHNIKIGRGEFFDERNMSSAYYPIMAPRKKRGVYAGPTAPGGLIEKDSLCYVDGETFVINGEPFHMGLSAGEKQLVSMGAYVIILPDRKYINTKNVEDRGSIEAEYSTADSGVTVTVELSTEDGSAMEDVTASQTAPASPANLQYWIDTSTTPNTLKRWSETSAMWVTIATTYLKVSAPGIGAQFKPYDGVSITGLGNIGLDGSFVLWSCAENYIVVTGIVDERSEITTPVTVSRKMPEMDFVVESENRLWGCRYGIAANGEIVNEIYASKQGDFRNWSCYMGISTDSYTASCGTDGQFTGAITYGGKPIFFKENYMHRVYGYMPSNFQIQSLACRGVEKGSAKSLAIVNETLFYKGRNGICAYDGSLPQEACSVLGDVRYKDAVGGAHGNNYYVSMADMDGKYHLFTYDTVRNIWHKEDNLQVDSWCSCRNEMYFIDHADKKIKTVFGSGDPAEKVVEWMAESGIIGTETPSGGGTALLVDHKYVSRLLVRMSMDLGAEVRFLIQYDSCGEWENVAVLRGSSLRSFAFPIRPKRCDHFRLRIIGSGDARIYSVSKTIEQGSDV